MEKVEAEWDCDAVKSDYVENVNVDEAVHNFEPCLKKILADLEISVVDGTRSWSTSWSLLGLNQQ